MIFDTFRSVGKGGQNVNKVEIGVRAIYIPTGQAVVCTEERSQHANKQKAVARLREMLESQNYQKKAEGKNGNWRCHTKLERGNAVTEFRGLAFIDGNLKEEEAASEKALKSEMEKLVSERI